MSTHGSIYLPGDWLRVEALAPEAYLFQIHSLDGLFLDKKPVESESGLRWSSDFQRARLCRIGIGRAIQSEVIA